MSYDYSYDNNGNITEIKQNGKLTNKYVYDSLNELKEEYDYVNKFYINYSYDGAGNLQNNMNRFLIQTTVIRQEHSMVIHTSTPIPAGRIS